MAQISINQQGSQQVPEIINRIKTEAFENNVFIRVDVFFRFRATSVRDSSTEYLVLLDRQVLISFYTQRFFCLNSEFQNKAIY